MARRSIPARLLRGFWFAVLAFVALTILVVGLMRWVDPPTSAFMLRERFSSPNTQLHHFWVEWDEIAAAMKLAVIAAEDQRFVEHRGFDFRSIDQALKQRTRGRVRGASTISQQVAKNLFLWSGRSWVRKGIEAYFTVLIESLWSKRRILEVYLNVAEFGHGVYGVGAASKTFFGKPAARLSAHEAALLAAVLPSPKRLRIAAPSAYVRSRQQWIMHQMNRLGGARLIQQLE